MPSHSRPRDRKEPDDIPAKPDSPSWSRRGFVRTANALFVASSLGPTLSACTTTAIAAIESEQTGTLRVTVTGFDPNATEAGTLSGTVGGQALAITLSPPSAGSSSGEATNVLVGTYDVTYTPPDDHALGSADIGMETKSVTVLATVDGDLSWVVEPVPLAGVLFHSDWSTALGTSSAAILDTDQTVPWEQFANRGGDEVIAAGALDFPTTNVLRTDAIWRGSPAGAFAQGPELETTLAIPGVGESLYYRFYVRVVTPDAYTVDPLTHPSQDGPGGGSNTNWQFEVVTNTDGTWVQRWERGDVPWPNNRWKSPALNKNQTYRFEMQIHRLTTTTGEMHVRTYDSNDVLLYTDADYDNINSSDNLASTPTFTFRDLDHLQGFRVGGNGWSGGVAGDYPFAAYYWGGVCIRTDDWCGPYANGI